jgi:hypothetical protein
MDTTLVFHGCGSASSDGDSMRAMLVVEVIQDGQDLGTHSVDVKIPAGAGVMGEDFLEVALPSPLGDGSHGKPELQHQAFRQAVANYLARLLFEIQRRPGDVEAYRLRWMFEYQTDPTSDEGGW